MSDWLEKHLPDIFMRGAEELSQGLVLGRIELRQMASPALVGKDPEKKHHLDHIDELDVLVHHALHARLYRQYLVRQRPVQALI